MKNLAPWHLLLLLGVLSSSPCSCQFVGSFNHGVASGDPLPGSVIIWTKLTPRISMTTGFADNLIVDWRVSTNALDLTSDSLPPHNGTAYAKAETDFTVKVDVKNLVQGKTYYYAFYAGAARSPVGRFRVPLSWKTPLQELRYALFSCANWGWGYFNAYDVASRLDLDFWLHLGDFIYEYGPDDHYPYPTMAVRYGPEPGGLQPPHEIVTLDDYRRRFALYREDPGLQALSAAAPVIAVWDDHEFANNPWVDGAMNHQPDKEGPWDVRKAAAIKAYHEWMPTRSGIEGTETYVGNRIWREFQFGNLATLLMLETRLTNRSNGELDPFPDVDDDGDGVPDNEDPATTARLRAASLVSSMSPTQWSPNVLNDLRDGLERYRSMADKTLLGQEQLGWLKARVEASKSAGTRWQLIGQQTVVLDSAHADVDQAIAAKSRTDINVSNLWAWQLHNVTGWDCSTPVICGSGSEHIKSYISLDPTAYRAQDYKKRKDVTPSLVASARAAYALSKYDVSSYFDSWEGYTHERTKFLNAFDKVAGSAVVYGGDSHNAWAGVHERDGTTVLAEYDCTSVTSTGKENFVPFLPPDLVAEALVRGIQNRTEGGGFTGSLAYSETESRGFTLVTLNKLEHKGQFLFVDSVASKEYSVSKCHQVDYDLVGRGRMAMKGSCTFEDPGRPYESQGNLHVSLCGCRPGQCRHGCTPIAESPVDGGSGAWIDKADGEGGLTDWLENAGSTVIDDLTNAATSSGAGAGTAAAVLAALVMVAGLIVLYRRVYAAEISGKYAAQTDAETPPRANTP